MAVGGNLLGDQSSPYLLQHAGNPVHWRPWGRAALEEAKARDCPILLSIGYAACHWCHVMAHESFEDRETASQMNALFVNVKVDREERPDIDHHYMTALHALGEQGGWPLTMFLSPDGAPIYGGTYWPPAPRWGRPSFAQVLQAVDNAWKTKREKLVEQGVSLTAHLGELAAPRPGDDLSPDDLTRIGEALLRVIDPVHGGVGGAPKFPNAPIFRFFASEYFRRGDMRFRAALRSLLDALCAGGIYDHLGGGFARYSTDAEWRVPHFEKMLYDNAQILELLALAHADTPSPVYAARARETFAWLMREMRVGDAFASSQDADQEGEEGRFYVWSEAEIDAELGAASPAFKVAYDIRPGGNWEGRNVLRRVTPSGSLEEERDLEASCARLFAARARRTPPPLDDKVLTDWNGLAIAALARASAVFAAPEFLAAARAAFDFLRRHLKDERGRIAHSWRAGKVGAGGMLDDYAAFARAALALFEATGEPTYLETAMLSAREAQALFGAPDGGLYLTAADSPDAPAIRARIAQDGATPCGVGLMAEVYARLYLLTDESGWRAALEWLTRAFSGVVPEELARSPLLLAAADMVERGGCVSVEGPLADPGSVALAAVALGAPDPALVTLRLDRALWPTGAPGARPPLVATPAAMLCRGQTCGLPTASAPQLRERLAAR